MVKLRKMLNKVDDLFERYLNQNASCSISTCGSPFTPKAASSTFNMGHWEISVSVDPMYECVLSSSD